MDQRLFMVTTPRRDPFLRLWPLLGHAQVEQMDPGVV